MNFVSNWLFKLSNKTSENYLSREDLFIFLNSEWKKISQSFQKINDLDSEYLNNLVILQENLISLDFSIEKTFIQEIHEEKDFDLCKWIMTLPESRVFSKGILQKDTGFHLYQFMKQKIEEKYLVRDNLNHLLRHIEVKRDKSVNQLSSGAGERDLWFERNYLAAAFAVRSKETKDWRFLNAALKMNQWRMNDYSIKYHFDEKIVFLLSLSEQERSIRELEQC